MQTALTAAAAALAAPPIAFQKFYVQNRTTGAKARVMYSATSHYGKRGEERPAVVLYAKDFNGDLGRVFAAEYRNDTDAQTDYFERGKVVLRPEHPLYAAALARAQARAA